MSELSVAVGGLMDRFGNPSVEEVFGTPEEIAAEHLEWPDPIDTPPLKQLRALCFRCMNHVSVGEPFRFRDEWIRLDEKRSTSYERWAKRRFQDSPVVITCPECGVETKAAPKGYVEVPF